jgi:prophage antirepressor-like protein
MEVVKAFNSNNLHTEIVIKGTYEEPLFRASDIGEVLEMGNIRTTIQNFNESEKVVQTIPTTGGSQEVSFLTEKGLYKVLFKSRKPIAEQFQNWVCEVIKDIRLTGKYELEKQLKDKEKEIEDKEKEIEEQKKQVEEKEKLLEDKDNEKNVLLTENEMLKNTTTKDPIIYIYQTDTRKGEKYFLKIGSTENFNQRAKPFNQVNPFGRMIYSVKIPKYNLKTIEFFIHEILKKYQVKQEIFDIDVDNAKYIISKLVNLLNFCQMQDQREQLLKLTKVVEYEMNILNDVDNIKISKREMSTQTDFEEEERIIVPRPTTSIIIDKNEQTFIDFINNHCIVEPTAEVSTVDIQGLYRIVYKNAEKEIYHAFMEFLKKKFLYARLHTQNKNENINGFRGVKLKEIVYTQTSLPTEEEIFVFNCCKFHPGAKVLMVDLFEEYKNWKMKLKKEINEEEDKKKLRGFLNKTNYVFFSTIWHNGGSGQGFYGLLLNKHQLVYERVVSSTAKKIEKRDYITDNVLNTWSTIKKASTEEGFSAAKMSRAVKNKIIFDNKHYYCEQRVLS